MAYSWPQRVGQLALSQSADATVTTTCVIIAVAATDADVVAIAATATTVDVVPIVYACVFVSFGGSWDQLTSKAR